MTKEEKEELKKNLRALQVSNVRVVEAFKSICLVGPMTGFAHNHEDLLSWGDIDLLLMMHPIIAKIDGLAVSKVTSSKKTLMYSTYSEMWID